MTTSNLRRIYVEKSLGLRNLRRIYVEFTSNLRRIYVESTSNLRRNCIESTSKHGFWPQKQKKHGARF